MALSVQLHSGCARRADRDGKGRGDIAAAARACWFKMQREYHDLLRILAVEAHCQTAYTSPAVAVYHGSAPSSPTISANDAHRYFDDEVATNDAPPPSFSLAPPGCILHDFWVLMTDDVTAEV